MTNISQSQVIEQWEAAMAALSQTAEFLNGLNVMDLQFDSGHSLEVYVVASQSERIRGLSTIDRFELDLDGMLFVFDKPTVTPFTAEKMVMDMEICWYDNTGRQIFAMHVPAGTTDRLICTQPFSYVLETPVNRMPGGNLLLNETASEARWKDLEYFRN